jgi:hypothetical protein
MQGCLMMSRLQSRTLWAERKVEEFLSLPLVSEFVFRSPQSVDGSQREVADFLVTCDAPGILISQKCQEDPTSRASEKLESWAYKRARKGVSQLTGALRTGTARPAWCLHPRRGRVDFPSGLPPVAHGLVLIEVLEPVVLRQRADEFPLEFQSVPISYFSLNDFLNLTVQLRTVPEIIEYLNMRRSLPVPDLRTLGEERSFFAFYLLNQGSFASCLGLADAKVAVASHSKRFEEMLSQKVESDRFSRLLEHVANELATRLPDFAKGLPAKVLKAFDCPENRENYLKMQLVLANLRLRERAELGRAFNGAVQKLANDAQGFVYREMRLDSHPEWVYILGASKNVNRTTLLSQFEPLMRGALAYFEKSRCLLVVDRDGVGYEVALSRLGYQPSVADYAVGNKLYGNLRTERRDFSLVVP